MTKKHKKVCTTLNSTKHILILGSTAAGCNSISDFAFLVSIPIGITTSAIGLRFWAISAAIRNYKSIIKKKKKKWNKIVLLAKCKLNSVDVLFSKSLINAIISYGEFVLINIVKRKDK